MFVRQPDDAPYPGEIVDKNLHYFILRDEMLYHSSPKSCATFVVSGACDHLGQGDLFYHEDEATALHNAEKIQAIGGHAQVNKL